MESLKALRSYNDLVKSNYIVSYSDLVKSNYIVSYSDLVKSNYTVSVDFFFLKPCCALFRIIGILLINNFNYWSMSFSNALLIFGE